MTPRVTRTYVVAYPEDVREEIQGWKVARVENDTTRKRATLSGIGGRRRPSLREFATTTGRVAA